jgi:DNA-binding transcriptional LysR family regulator
MIRRRLPSLSALRTFEALARTLNFTRAAEELGVTQAAVSRQIKLLETDLAVRLVNRSSGRNTLTDAGALLFNGVYKAFETIESSVETITGSDGREILNVSVAPYFSAQWLTPRLMPFLTRHPEIDLRLHHSYHPADHRRDGIDIGINWGAGVWPGVEKIKIMDGSLTAVASPAFVERTGGLDNPAKLMTCPLFCEFDVNHWKLWLERAGVPAGSAINGLRLSDSHALRRVALDGHGVALFFAALIDEDLASGGLVRPFATTVHVGYDYYLNHPSDSDLPRKTKLFRRYVLEETGLGG